MALATKKDWRLLDSALKERHDFRHTKHISHMDLSNLCLAVVDYCTGLLCTHAPWLKQRTDNMLIDKRKDALERSQSSLRLLSPGWAKIENYFCINVLLVRAEANWVANEDDVPTIRESYQFCEEARLLTDHIRILEPE